MVATTESAPYIKLANAVLMSSLRDAGVHVRVKNGDYELLPGIAPMYRYKRLDLKSVQAHRSEIQDRMRVWEWLLESEGYCAWWCRVAGINHAYMRNKLILRYDPYSYLEELDELFALVQRRCVYLAMRQEAPIV